MSRAPDLSPREAVERWLDKLRVDKAESTVSGYWYRLKIFVEWCEAEGIDSVRDLSGWDLDSYEAKRRRDEVSPVTLANELTTLRQWLAYCARIELVEESLPDKVEPPSIDADDEVNDTKLPADRAQALIAAFRGGDEYATAPHVLLELAWFTAARMGAIRALDLRDIDTEAATLDFQFRPRTGTPLKKGDQGERLVGIPSQTATVIDDYVTANRQQVPDEHGRQPLLTTTHGRAALNTLRGWCYYATVPCRHRDCPHGKERPGCDWYGLRDSSGCPSSLSPHRVRTGSITWQCSQGIPIEVVSKRANASPEVIRKHYDHEEKRREFQQRRAQHLDKLEFTDDDE